MSQFADPLLQKMSAPVVKTGDPGCGYQTALRAVAAALRGFLFRCRLPGAVSCKERVQCAADRQSDLCF